MKRSKTIRVPSAGWLEYLTFWRRIGVLCLSLSGSVAFGQASAAKDRDLVVAANLSSLYLEKAKQIIERHVPPREVQVFVTVTPKAGSAEILPYMPNEEIKISSLGFSAARYAKYIKTVEIEVLLSQRYLSSSKSISSLLTKGLALSTQRGDKIKFAALGLVVAPTEDELQRRLTQADLDLRELKSKVETITRDKDVLVQEKDTIVAERDRLSKATPKGFWRDNASTLILSLTLAVGLLMAGMMLRGAAKILGSAVASIGQSIPVLGDKLNESMITSHNATQQNTTYRLEGGRTDPMALLGNGQQSMPIEAVARRVVELHTELKELVHAEHDGLILEHLGWLLTQDTSIDRAVATMELLGVAKANELFRKMNVEQQQRVTSFLKNGTHSRPKGEVMLEAGEVLKTKLFGATLSGGRQLDPSIQRKMSQLKSADILILVQQLSGETLARLFLYIEPSRLVEVLTQLQSDPQEDKFASIAKVIIKMPEVEASVSLDKQVGEVVDQHIATSQGDIQLGYLSYYKTLVEGLDDERAEALSRQLSALHPQIDRYLSETVITFATFFKLQKDIQAEVLQGFSNKDLAALLVGLAETQKTGVLDFIDKRRSELVEEEVERMAARGSRQTTTAHRAAQKQVVARIKQLKGSGTLVDLLAQNVEKEAAATQSIKKLPAA